jgi:hypothetical protein
MGAYVEMSVKARRELTKASVNRYRTSKRKDKSSLLNEFCAATGYNRDYAAALLRTWGNKRRVEPGGATPARQASPKAKGGRPPVYGKDTLRILKVLWKRFDFLCGKRLVPLIRASLAFLRDDRFLHASPGQIRGLASISPATADRMLASERKKYTLRGHTYTRSGESLKNLVPVRTFDEWKDCPPGHAQIDTVGHDGGFLSGECSFTLCMTDVCTGWTERYAMKNRAFKWVNLGLDAFRAAMPFPLVHLHPDGGSEFINHAMIAYCNNPDHPVALTRSRAGKKNDNCHVEQKNFDTVRKLVGYARYSTPEMLETLNALYHFHGLLLNYFYPSQKLIEKTRVGSKVKKRYDVAQSPVERLLAHSAVSEPLKSAVGARRACLDPLWLAGEVDRLSGLLRELLEAEAASPTKIRGASS